MMVITHVAVALAFAVPVALAAPEFATAAAVGAILGGALPDLDLLVGEHRRTFHFPVVGPVLAVLGLLPALVFPTPLTVGIALALVVLNVAITLVNAALLFPKIKPFLDVRSSLMKATKLVLASVGMIAVMLVAKRIAPFIDLPFVRIFFISIAGACAYLACSRILQLDELRFILTRIPIIGAGAEPKDEGGGGGDS